MYLVTDRQATGGRPQLDCVEAALRGGVSAVQLREKNLPAAALVELAGALRELTARHGAALLINDRVDVAMAVDADGVHMPASSFAIGDARRLLGADKLVAVSTHDPAEVAEAAAQGADFAVFGPVYDTPSKRPYGEPLGLESLARAALAAIPVIAIGGITSDRVAEVRSAGAAGAAAIRALLSAPDPEAAARGLLPR